MRGKDKWDTDREKSCSRRFALIFTDKNKKEDSRQNITMVFGY